MRPTVPHRSTREKRTRETSGSPGTEAPSHRRPLGLWCPKQPPRRHSGDRRPGGGSPEGAPATSPPGGRPFDLPPRQRAPRHGRPCGVPRRAHRASLAALATPDRRPGLATLLPIRWSASRSCDPSARPPLLPRLATVPARVRSPRVGTSTAWSEAKTTSGPRQGQLHISAGQGIYLQVRASGERVTNRRTGDGRQGSCWSRAVRAASKFSRVTDIRIRSTHRPSFHERSASRASCRNPECAYARSARSFSASDHSST